MGSLPERVVTAEQTIPLGLLGVDHVGFWVVLVWGGKKPLFFLALSKSLMATATPLPPQVTFAWSNQLPRERGAYVWDYGFDPTEPETTPKPKAFCDRVIVRIAPAACVSWDGHLTGGPHAPLGDEVEGLCEVSEAVFEILESWGFQIDSVNMLTAHMEEQGFVHAPGAFEFGSDHMLQ
jgi:hypothetical protein